MLDVEESKLDHNEKSFTSNVRQHGWTATHVFEDSEGAGFSYTTGFWHKFHQPELVIFGLPSDISHEILWGFYRDIEGGKELVVDTPMSGILEGYDVILKLVLKEHFSDHLGWSRWFYGGDHFEAYQIIFPDKLGHFPWDSEASPEFRSFQPNLVGIEY